VRSGEQANCLACVRNWKSEPCAIGTGETGLECLVSVDLLRSSDT